jgi:hypothetical protein
VEELPAWWDSAVAVFLRCSLSLPDDDIATGESVAVAAVVEFITSLVELLLWVDATTNEEEDSSILEVVATAEVTLVVVTPSCLLWTVTLATSRCQLVAAILERGDVTLSARWLCTYCCPHGVSRDFCRRFNPSDNRVGTGDLDPTGESEEDEEEDDLDLENSTGLESSGVLTLLLVDTGEILFLSAEMAPPLLVDIPPSFVEESPLSFSDTFTISALPPRLAATGDSDNAVLCVDAPLTLTELAAVSLLAPPSAANFSDSATSSVMLCSVLAALSKVVALVVVMLVMAVEVGVTVVVVVEERVSTRAAETEVVVVVRVVAFISAVALKSQISTSASLAVTERAVVVERGAVVVF